jgi:hypothetical protein
MARPRKNEEKHRAERVTWRISADVKEGLKRLALERSADVSDVAHQLLEQGLAAEQRKQRRRA